MHQKREDAAPDAKPKIGPHPAPLGDRPTRHQRGSPPPRRTPDPASLRAHLPALSPQRHRVSPRSSATRLRPHFRASSPSPRCNASDL